MVMRLRHSWSRLQPRWAIGIAAAAVMLGTRLGHFAGLPDASWAVFFIAGIYLRSAQAFLLLMMEAVGIDWLATQQLGISRYCISPAYVFLLPAYGSLWLGGEWFARLPIRIELPALARLAAALSLAVSACFLWSDASFYWLSGRVTERSVAGWLANDAIWFPAFLEAAYLYVGVAALLHVAVTRARRSTSPHIA
jgi:hypothetical protein